MKNIYLTSLFILAFFQFVFGQNTIIETSLDTNRITIGEQTDFTISVFMDKDVESSISFPNFKDSLISGIEVIDQNTDTFLLDNSIEISKRFTITSFDTNYYIIPQFSILLVNDTLKSASKLFQVISYAINNEKPLNDINKNINFSYTFSDYIDLFISFIINNKWWFIITTILIAVFIIILMKLKNKKTVEEVIELDPPHIEAFIKLMKIKDMKLWENDNLKPFYTESTEVIKRYLNRKFNVLTFEKTSDEIIKSLKFIDLTREEISILNKLLSLSDLVKFAKEKPIESENIEVLNLCESWIKNIESKTLEDKNEE